jgi:hypothetical protein
MKVCTWVNSFSSGSYTLVTPATLLPAQPDCTAGTCTSVNFNGAGNYFVAVSTQNNIYII